MKIKLLDSKVKSLLKTDLSQINIENIKYLEQIVAENIYHAEGPIKINLYDLHLKILKEIINRKRVA